MLIFLPDWLSDLKNQNPAIKHLNLQEELKTPGTEPDSVTNIVQTDEHEDKEYY